MINSLSYLFAEGTDPYQNIADEALLMEEVKADEVILFLWQNQHTIVVGRNQSAWAECDVESLEKDGGHFTRRLSGGGAVYHDLGNVNFTFLAQKDNYDLEKQNLVLKKAMEKLGLSIERSGRNDLLVDGRKFSGHAYYRQGEMCYHHGTILVHVDTDAMAKYLRVSKNKMASKGVQSVRSRVCNLIEFLPEITPARIYEALIEAFSEVYGHEAKEISLKDKDQDLRKEKRAFFSSPEWLYGPRIPLDIQIDERFSWGEVKVELLVNAGIIEDARVYSDAMQWKFASVLEERLPTTPFKESALKEVVQKVKEESPEIGEEEAKDLESLVEGFFA